MNYGSPLYPVGSANLSGELGFWPLLVAAVAAVGAGVTGATWGASQYVEASTERDLADEAIKQVHAGRPEVAYPLLRHGVEEKPSPSSHKWLYIGGGLVLLLALGGGSAYAKGRK